MTSEDFIDLGSDNVNEATESDIDNQTLQPIEHPDEANPDSVNLEKVEQDGRENVVESVNTVESGNKEDRFTEFTAVKDHMIEESTTIGVKRSRMTTDERPSVHVVFKSLTRASRKKLEELLHHWSEWHAKNESSSDVSLKEELEHGEETYFPALYVGRDKSAMVVSPFP